MVKQNPRSISSLKGKSSHHHKTKPQDQSERVSFLSTLNFLHLVQSTSARYAGRGDLYTHFPHELAISPERELVPNIFLCKYLFMEHFFFKNNIEV